MCCLVYLKFSNKNDRAIDFHMSYVGPFFHFHLDRTFAGGHRNLIEGGALCPAQFCHHQRVTSVCFSMIFSEGPIWTIHRPFQHFGFFLPNAGNTFIFYPISFQLLLSIPFLKIFQTVSTYSKHRFWFKVKTMTNPDNIPLYNNYYNYLLFTNKLTMYFGCCPTGVTFSPVGSVKKVGGWVAS